MSHTDAHPSAIALSEFALGTLSDEDQFSVEEHLLQCDPCLQRAANTDARDDFVELLVAATTVLGAPNCLAGEADTGSTKYDATIAGLGSAPRQPAAEMDSDGRLPLAGHPRYRVEKLLGRGGMGSVWLSEHLLIRADLVQHPEAVERFRREVQAAAKVQHPNIATAYDAEHFQSVHFLVMEYVSGQLLSERIASGPLPLADACRIVSEVAKGLAHAHAAGLVHRDIKPGNLMLSDKGVIKILDFGLVTLPQLDSQITGGDVVMGTVDYIAPEQAEDPRRADARSDIYSLGCTLFELLAGHPPFAGTPLQKLDARRRQRPPTLVGVPDSLRHVVGRMMATRPGDRFQGADEVISALAPYCHVGLPAEPRRDGARRGARAAKALLALIVAVAAGLSSYRIVTDKGEILFEVDGASARVVIKQDDQVISIVEPHHVPKVKLRTGRYDLALETADASVILSVDEVTIERGRATVVRIDRAPDPASDADGLLQPVMIYPERILPAARGLVSDVVFTHDSRRVISCSLDDGRILAWNLDTGAVETEFHVEADTVLSLDVAEQGGALVGAGESGVVHLWTMDGKQRRPLVRDSLPQDSQRVIGCVKCSPNGQLVAACSHSGDVAIWDLAKRKLLKTLPGPNGPTYSIAWSRLGDRLAYGNDPVLFLTSLDDDVRSHSIRNGGNWSDEAFSPDGRMLAAATWGGWIHLFDANDLALKTKFPVDATAPLCFRSVVFVTNDIVIGSGVVSDLYAWNVSGEKERLIASFDGHNGFVQRIAISQDNRLLATCSDRGEIGIWKLPGAWLESDSTAGGAP
jgi:hypothetical protein